MIQNIADDSNPEFRVTFGGFLELFHCLTASQQCGTTTSNNSFLQGSLSCCTSIIDQSFSLFHLGFGGRTHVDLGNTTSEFGQALLQLFTVVVAVGLIDLASNLLNPTFDVGFLTATTNDCRRFTGDPDFLGTAQIFHLDTFKVNAEILEDCFTAGQYGDISEDRLAAVAVTRSLDSTGRQDASHLVDDQRCQCLALDVLSDDQQRFLRFADCLQKRNHLLVVADFFFKQQNVTVFEFDAYVILVGDKVW